MNRLRPVFVLVLMLLAACTRTWVEPQYQRPASFATWVDTTPSVYRIQPGDDLSVVLPFNGELNYRGPVAPDGTLSMPFAGTVPAAGLSVAQLAGNIDKALAANGVAAHAQASVAIAQSSSHVYVGGQVAKPGEIPLHPGMNVMQAVIAAQGLLDTARTHEIVLIRRSPDGRPMLRTIDVDAFTQTGDPAQDVVLQTADVVFVPKSSIAEVDQWVDQYIDKVLPFNRGFDYTISNNPTYP
ncbi:polysaccharide biosynthesis/export family protein [Paraburkholderia ferrariae]|uniref:polysaccharide biosynthesis/export family protein n=1 Tax=Paraburkholderia ferrariae TaxID=386056 RepID=UPI0004811BC4|nr:polysaccharide biosynthesis/export family protein [Paraburkholderia ferrariae]